MKRPAPTPENHLIFSAITWVAVSFAGMVLSDAGVYGAKSIVEATALVALALLFPDEPRRAWSAWLLAACVALALAFLAGWLLIYALPNVADFKFPAKANLRTIDVVAGFVATGLIAPLFEEKLARHLALRGCAGVIGPAVSRYIHPGIPASLIISTIFALSHPSVMLLAFPFSIVLCVLALRYEYNFLQRAIIHGLFNSAVMAWYLTQGFGFQG